MNLSALTDRQGYGVGRLMVLHDFTKRKLAEEKLREISLVDELTGLNNRRGFNMRAAQLMQMAARMQMGVALIYADLDGLKAINDPLGHAAGDQALAAAAGSLKGASRASDIVARLGGDAFAILALESSEPPANALLGRLLAQLDAHNTRADRPFALSISFGQARSEPGAPRPLEALLDEADRAMYADKAERKPA